ncbi:MAG: hypothetical protein SOY19_04695, partial [Prevotella sp.]|uniref:hypothetical protein n=1 Tax=Leyella stercorea TaxID=363265 RepID=UPI002800E601|nr:hypothetical protein [Leyella stercorea]MDY4198079.1 hypothetical protein [Prevotella sp.]
CKFSYFYWLSQILIYLFLLLLGKTNVGAVVFTFCTDRRPIGVRPPSDRFPSAVQSDSVRRPIGFRSPSDQIASASGEKR